MAETDRTAKPTGETGRTSKGAGVSAHMGEPGSPTGPNETEEGIIKSPAPEGPGPDQIGLVGGDPTESIQSTPPLEEPAAKGKEARDNRQAERR